MPVVELRNVGQAVIPDDHFNPATQQDVEAGAEYSCQVHGMLQSHSPYVTAADLAAAQLHLHDTCDSYLSANPASHAVKSQEQLRQSIIQTVRNEVAGMVQTEVQAMKDEIATIRQALERQREKMDFLMEIAIDSSVTAARNLNYFRSHGNSCPLLPVRLADGKLPEIQFTSESVVRDLDLPEARFYVRTYNLERSLPENPTLQMYQDAIARHVGANR